MQQKQINHTTLRVLAPWTWATFITFWFLVGVFVLAAAGDEGTAGSMTLLADICYQSLSVLIFPWFLLLKTGLFKAGWYTLLTSILFCSVLYGFIIARGIIIVKNLLSR